MFVAVRPGFPGLNSEGRGGGLRKAEPLFVWRLHDLAPASMADLLRPYGHNRKRPA